MRLVLLLSSGVLLAGCSGAAPVLPEQMRLVGPSAEEQVAVMEQCRAGFGVGGDADYQVDVGPALGGGRTANVIIIPSDQVTLQWADRINDCAASQLNIAPLARPVVATASGSRVVCPAGSSGMTGGTSYCRVRS